MPRKTSDGMANWLGIFKSSSFNNGSCHLIASMANMGVIESKEGLVIFDVPMRQFANKSFKELRGYTSKQVKYFIFSHGHFDHAFGYAPYLNEIEEHGWELPQVIAHENCLRRFEKYRMLNKYHEWINKMQFASVIGTKQTILVTAEKVLEPTIILKGNDAKYSFDLGGYDFHIFHDRGETDDSIWLWVPDKETICTGDLFVSSFPNVGNPFKVQRYPKDWAIAMEKMVDKDSKYLVPGHGPLIVGKENVREALTITAEVMHFVHDEVVKGLNEGKWFEQIYHELIEIFPEKFKDHPMLKPMYGCYQFAIHASYRLYHGWYNSGNPTDLFPSKSQDISKELLKLNDEKVYLNHAKDLFYQNELQLALHILDILIKGADFIHKKTLLEALQLKNKILKLKVQQEPSFIAANIIDNARYQIRNQIKDLIK